MYKLPCILMTFLACLQFHHTAYSAESSAAAAAVAAAAAHSTARSPGAIFAVPAGGNRKARRLGKQSIEIQVAAQLAQENKERKQKEASTQAQKAKAKKAKNSKNLANSPEAKAQAEAKKIQKKLNGLGRSGNNYLEQEMATTQTMIANLTTQLLASTEDSDTHADHAQQLRSNIESFNETWTYACSTKSPTERQKALAKAAETWAAATKNLTLPAAADKQKENSAKEKVKN